MENSLIVVEQLPVITEHLAAVKEKIAERVDTALNLVCANDTAKEMKLSEKKLKILFLHLTQTLKKFTKSVLAMYIQVLILI